MVVKQVECKKIKELLQLYIDNDLTPYEKGAVEGHLKECLTCRTELNGLSSTVKLIKSLPEISPPPDFMEKVMLKISQVKR